MAKGKKKRKNESSSDSSSSRGILCVDLFWECLSEKMSENGWFLLARDTLRGPFLGVPLGQDERKQLVDDYYCCPVDYREFSAPTIQGEFIIHKFSYFTNLFLCRLAASLTPFLKFNSIVGLN